MRELDEFQVRSLLAELGERLEGRGIEADIYVVGGAAMILAYNRARVTQDIDAVFVPQSEIEVEVRAMAADHRDLDPDWLNAKVLPLLPRSIDADRLEVIGAPGITVNVASPRFLLAMKARSGRERRDLDDVWVLCQILGLKTVVEVWAICDQVWGDDLINEDARQTVTAYLLGRGLR